MKILFKNKTKYTKNAYKKYLQFHQNKYGKNYEFTTILIILLLIFCIILNLKYKNFHTFFAITIALISFCIYRFFYPIKKIQKELKTEKFAKEKTFTFTFYEKFFVISDKKSSKQIKYWRLYRIYETEDFFYLYVNKEYAFLLDKSTFSIGNISTFQKFIKEKIWYKIFL